MNEIIDLRRGMPFDQLHEEVQRGGRFVVYPWAVSVIILSFRNASEVYYIAPGESSLKKGLPFIFISLLAGWWGFPFGPIFTIWCLCECFSGGRDITNEVMSAMYEQAQNEQYAREQYRRQQDPYAEDPYADAY